MSKKPAKKPTTNGTNVLIKKNEGDLVRFIGSKGAGHTCPECGKTVIRGMLRQYKTEMYCSKTCAVKVISKEEEIKND